MFGLKKLTQRLEVLERDAALAAEKIEYLERKLRVRGRQLYELQEAVNFLTEETGHANH